MCPPLRQTNRFPCRQTCAHYPDLMPALQGCHGEEGKQRPEEVVEVDHARQRAGAVVFAALSLAHRESVRNNARFTREYGRGGNARDMSSFLRS